MIKFQFGIRAILIFTFAAAIVMAVFSRSGSFVSNILLTVLLANFIGAVVALIVTFVGGFPVDGSLRKKDDPADEDVIVDLGDENEFAR